MATITMEASKVIEAAQAVIDLIMKERAVRDEEARNNKRKGMYTIKWLPFPRIVRGTYTDEEVEKAIMAEPYGGWYYPSCYAWGTLEHTRKLLTIAKHGDPVVLNEEDTHVLFG